MSVHKCASAEENLNVNYIYTGMRVWEFVRINTGQYAAGLFQSITASHREGEICFW